MQECSTLKSNGMFSVNMEKKDAIASDPRSG